MNLTEEQLTIVDETKESKQNLLVIARAGAAKTTSLIEVAKALPRAEVLALAFNKAIAQEMKERMPQNVICRTLNGVGYHAYSRFRGHCRIDSGKMYRLLKAAVEELDEIDKKEVYEVFSDLLRSLGLAKASGYIPEEALSLAKGYHTLVDEMDFLEGLDLEITPLLKDLLNSTLIESFKEALEGIIDFDDQILMPTLGPAQFEKPDVTLVDEAQDLSPLNHAMLHKIVGKRRLIAVGDPCQAIYAFRGADESSMQSLRLAFDMKELYLTISFRCAKAIVKNAQWRAPDMRWPEWAAEGEVRILREWGADLIPDGSAIICRNNAPIFGTAIRLLRDGRLPEIMGRDVLKGLITKMGKLGKKSMPQDEAFDAIDAWVVKESKRIKNKSLLHDQADCMRVFVGETEDLGGAIVYAQDLLKREGRIKLMTGHKAKGLEFDEVFFLDPQLLRAEGKNQDRNVRYVIETRAKTRLTYVESDHYGGR